MDRQPDGILVTGQGPMIESSGETLFSAKQKPTA